MKGIIYDETKKHYKIKIENLDTYSKNLEAAIDKVKNIFYPQNATLTGKKWVKKSFFYQNHYFISYWHKNKPYFDIKHIISILNLKPIGMNSILKLSTIFDIKTNLMDTS